MGKVLKIREVGDPILNKTSDEVDIENINEDILDIIGLNNVEKKKTKHFYHFPHTCLTLMRWNIFAIPLKLRHTVRRYASASWICFTD
mgnify:CR=1 FL=1